ncbi:MAG TPA: hypothetical protein VD789_05435 [Thermomicrobiales bacterium]|nr:hypothetical protein [Thermomicrobiales bacterium]
MGLFSGGEKARLKKAMAVVPRPFFEGYQFTLKGSPRHYDDVRAIIQAGGEAEVYFGEALAYERGAGIALWRVRAREFGWLDRLYDWWVEAERVEPVQFTFHLYLPDNLKYPALDLREHPPEEVAAFIRERAPYVRDQ